MFVGDLTFPSTRFYFSYSAFVHIWRVLTLALQIHQRCLFRDGSYTTSTNPPHGGSSPLVTNCVTIQYTNWGAALVVRLSIGVANTFCPSIFSWDYFSCKFCARIKWYRNFAPEPHISCVVGGFGSWNDAYATRK